MAEVRDGREDREDRDDPATGGGTEGPRGHEAGSRTNDKAVPWRVFVVIGTVIGLISAIYWFTSYEEAGTAMLALAGVLAVWCGIYLWLQERPRADQRPAEAPGQPGGTTTYLPHASVWPFAIGLGAATLFNGLVLGIWVLLPGAAMLAVGIGGWVRQTRHRD